MQDEGIVPGGESQRDAFRDEAVACAIDNTDGEPEYSKLGGDLNLCLLTDNMLHGVDGDATDGTLPDFTSISPSGAFDSEQKTTHRASGAGESCTLCGGQK